MRPVGSREIPDRCGRSVTAKLSAPLLWIASFVAAATGIRAVFTITPTPEDTAWLLGRAWVRSLVETAIVLFAGVMLLQYATVAWKRLNNRPRTYRSAEAFKSLEYFFPATLRERRWWALVSVAAGFCEEILFRGFFASLLARSALDDELDLALLISSLVFGWNHLYGGVGGVVGSALAGFLLGLLFLLSGNLLLPVALHALLDLRALVILKLPA